MPLTVKELISLLRVGIPSTVFYNSTIDKSKECVGVYRREAGKIQPVGGGGSSYDILPVTILIHWSENSDRCEEKASAIYSYLDGLLKTQTPSGVTISYVQLLNSAPVWVGRDENNVAEYVIRANITYERGA